MFYASRLAANLYGSSAGQLPDLNHRDHDLLLGQVYLVFRAIRPTKHGNGSAKILAPKQATGSRIPMPFWLMRPERPFALSNLPDAIPASQVESFHDHCVEHGLPYELW